MPGFLISNIRTENYPYLLKDHKGIKGSIETTKYTIKCNVLAKFQKDRLFAESGNYIVILDGVILNKRDLLSKYGNDNWEDYVFSSIENDSEYFSTLRGSFSGAHYEKDCDRWVIYTDFMSTKPVFYYNKDGKFIVSEDLYVISQILAENGIKYSIDEDAIYDELTYGYMIGNRTYINEVKKLSYGSYLVISSGETEVIRYYDFKYWDGQTHYSESELVNRMDELFREAVRLEYEKDLEYGYKHLVTLSGGYDSRMNAWIAKKLGYNDILNLCFCESDMLDEKCAKKVSQALKTELIVKSLNGGAFLKDISKTVKLECGLINYTGISHCLSALEILDDERFGLIHTGELGDVVIGTYYDEMTAKPSFVIDKELYCDRVNDLFDNAYECPEKFLMRNRGFNGCVSTWMAQGHYSETVSPFLYKEFFDFCLTNIPQNIRRGHKIYEKWIKEKWLEAGKIPSERLRGGIVTDGKVKRYVRIIQYYGIAKCLDWFLRKIGIKKKRMRFDKSMNPMDKWYLENSELREVMDCYMKTTVDSLLNESIICKNLGDDLTKQYTIGDVNNKASVITVLASLDLLFNADKDTLLN